MNSAVSAFPYRRWPHVSREQVAATRGLLRAFGGEPLRRARAQGEALLGAPLRILPGAPSPIAAAEAQRALAPPQTVLVLEQRREGRVLPIAVELAPELGARLVDRVLGGEGRAAHVPGEALDELSLGVLAYLGARMLAAAGGGLQLRGALRGDEERSAFAVGSGLVWPFALELDGLPLGGLRVFVAEQTAARLGTTPAQNARAPLPAALRSVPVAVCAHAARVTLLRSELAALGCGDVVIPERVALERDGRGFAGQVRLHVEGSSRGGWLCTARGAEIVIDTLDATGETIMTEGKRIETQALEQGAGGDALRAAADAPIELCLELARFTLPLGELSALRAGEVLNTGRAIGERVTLSAGGRAFARGELVEVDGEIGVRVTELL